MVNYKHFALNTKKDNNYLLCVMEDCTISKIWLAEARKYQKMHKNIELKIMDEKTYKEEFKMDASLLPKFIYFYNGMPIYERYGYQRPERLFAEINKKKLNIFKTKSSK